MFYTDYDENVNGYCVFNTENEIAYASYISEEEAEQDAKERNDSIDTESEKTSEEYKKVIEYVKKAIYTEHCTMNHMENTEYEKGQINGLITALSIVKKAFQ